MPSVVIPAHNEEAGIERTLRGVLADAVPDLEIVVVVNATTDRTAEIAAGVDHRLGDTERTRAVDPLADAERGRQRRSAGYTSADLQPVAQEAVRGRPHPHKTARRGVE